MKKIKLTQNQYALVDDEDFEKVNQFKWCAAWEENTKSFRALRRVLKDNGKQTSMLMHRYIMNTPLGMVTDHRNHNTLDNQKSNLRTCTNQQNQANRKNQKNVSSKYKGAYWHKLNKKWVAQIQSNRKFIYLGSFKSEIEAAKAYNEKAKELFGEFAFLNRV